MITVFLLLPDYILHLHKDLFEEALAFLPWSWFLTRFVPVVDILKLQPVEICSQRIVADDLGDWWTQNQFIDDSQKL